MNLINSKNCTFMVAFAIVLLLVFGVLVVSHQDRSSIYADLFASKSE